MGLADRVTVRKSFEWNFSRILRMAFVGVSQRWSWWDQSASGRRIPVRSWSIVEDRLNGMRWGSLRISSCGLVECVHATFFEILLRTLKLGAARVDPWGEDPRRVFTESQEKILKEFPWGSAGTFGRNPPPPPHSSKESLKDPCWGIHMEAAAHKNLEKNPKKNPNKNP